MSSSKTTRQKPQRRDYDRSFLQLVRAAVAGDAATVSKGLAAEPRLLEHQAKVGASRGDAERFFFEQIQHYLSAGDTLLHMAAAAFRPKITQKLIALGANPSIKNRLGAEPLHYAADANVWKPAAQAATIRALLAAGANPNALDKNGVAPLHRAVRTRSAAAVRALLLGGAKPRLKNKRGSTPLHLAVQTTGRGGSGSTRAKQQQRQIIELLIEAGAQPKDKDASGRTAIQAASSDWVRQWIG